VPLLGVFFERMAEKRRESYASVQGWMKVVWGPWLKLGMGPFLYIHLNIK